MIVIRSFDVNKPGAEIDHLGGGSILTGVLKLSDEIEIRPGLVTTDETGKIQCRTIFSRITSLFAGHNDLKFGWDPRRSDPESSGPSGRFHSRSPWPAARHLHGIGGQRLPAPPSARRQNRAVKVGKLTKNELLMVNIRSTAAGAKVINVKADAAKLSLTTPTCTEIEEKIAISRRHERHG